MDESISEWPCVTCTFLNPSVNSVCIQCDTCRHLPSQYRTCPACTFSNPAESNSCTMCNTPIPSVPSQEASNEVFFPSSQEKGNSMKRKRLQNKGERENSYEKLLSDGKKEETKEPAVENLESINSLLSSLNKERMARRTGAGPSLSKRAAMVSEPEKNVSIEGDLLSILSYNVWFREDLEVEARMAAIGAIISDKSPHVICLQEVTPSIYKLFQSSPWWKHYKCSLTPSEASTRPYFTMMLSKLAVRSWLTQPYSITAMGRELCVLGLESSKYHGLLVGTTHLESPCPGPPSWDQMFSKERKSQASEALQSLDRARNAIFCGDMNWDEKKDGSPPLPVGWIDAWAHVHPSNPGFTYDSKENKMLAGGRLRLRLDRFFCKLSDFVIKRIEMVGTEAIPDVTYGKSRKVKGKAVTTTLPVFPSDHFGVFVEITAIS